jgi:CubicO group peptidase (beta-lactamase class C family)
MAMTTKLSELIPELQELLEEQCRTAGVPGATLAVALGDEMIELAAGVLNLETGVEATTDSLFQIGSITKVYTATLVMQLVDEGLVDLDAPVRTYVPEFSVADESATEEVTVRQLLCHTCGFDGDVFDDFGRGEEAIARYVEALKDRQQVYEPGRLFSYCNSGYSVLGRLVERVREVPSWHAALREHLIKPLGLTRTASLPEEAIMHRVATGHLEDKEKGDGARRLAPFWHLAFANAPAGSTLCASAADVLRFVRMHQRGGLAQDGTRVLSEESAAAMQASQTVLPSFDDANPNGWGLGWMLFDFPHVRLVGHDGSTVGQASHMRYAPEHDLSFAVLTNGGDPTLLMYGVRSRVLSRLAGIEVAAPPIPPQPEVEVDPARFVGRYENVGFYHEVTEDTENGGLRIEMGMRGALAEQLSDEKPETFRFVGFDGAALITAEPDHGTHWRIGFAEPGADGRVPYLVSGLRVALRVADERGWHDSESGR